MAIEAGQDQGQQGGTLVSEVFFSMSLRFVILMSNLCVFSVSRLISKELNFYSPKQIHLESKISMFE